MGKGKEKDWKGEVKEERREEKGKGVEKGELESALLEKNLKLFFVKPKMTERGRKRAKRKGKRRRKEIGDWKQKVEKERGRVKEELGKEERGKGK